MPYTQSLSPETPPPLPPVPPPVRKFPPAWVIIVVVVVINVALFVYFGIQSDSYMPLPPNSTATAATAAPASFQKTALSPHGGFAVAAPDGWRVEEKLPDLAKNQWTHELNIRDANSKRSVALSVGHDATGSTTARQFLATVLKAIQQQKPQTNLNVLAAYEIPADKRGSSRVTAEIRSTDDSGTRLGGRIWITLHGNGQFLFTAIESAENDFSADTARLLDGILASVEIKKPDIFREFYEKLPKPTLAPLRTVPFPDGSATIAAPQDWQFLGGQEDAYAFTSNDKRWGFTNTTIAVHPAPNPWLPANQQQFIHPFARPLDFFKYILEKEGKTDIRVLERQDNEAAARQFSQMGFRAISEIFLLTARDPKTGNTLKVSVAATSTEALNNNAAQYGGLQLPWIFTLRQIYGPEELFDRNIPVFGQMIASYRENPEYWAAKNRATAAANNSAAEHQRRMFKQNQETADYLRNSQRERFDRQMRSKEYVSYLHTSAIRGEQDYLTNRGSTIRSNATGTTNLNTGRRVEALPYQWTEIEATARQNNINLQKIDTRELYEQHIRGR